MTICRVARAAVLVCLVGIPTRAAAQTITDTQVWTGAGVDLDMSDRLRLTWEHSLRFHDDVSALDSAFHELAARFELHDAVRLKAGYRYYMVRGGVTAHRLFGDVSARYRAGKAKWELEYRARLQTTTRPDPDEDLTYLRNRLQAGFAATDAVSPFASFEHFYRFRDQGTDEGRRYRISAGADWDVAKRVSLSLFYTFQREINVAQPEQDHILGVELSYGLDRR